MIRKRYFPLLGYRKLSFDEMKERSLVFYSEMKKRKSIRQFSTFIFPREVIENCILAASTAPSGANRQPWKFIVVSDPQLKKVIRLEAEKREREFYQDEATKNWVKDLKNLGTNADKPFLVEAPYLIVIFAQRYSWTDKGEKIAHYYVPESVGIATGILITAIHLAGLACLTYTPPKIGFLNNVLHRPSNERPLMILVVGFPSENSRVPEISKKTLSEMVQFF